MADLPSLRALHYFQQAARFENFSLAAESLNVTHSAISHQIRQLEAQLATPLFTRSHGRVFLTPAGERLKKSCLQAFGELERACHEIKNQGVSPLTIACAPSFLAQWLLSRIGRFSERYADIPLTFQTCTDIEQLKSGYSDVLLLSHERPVDPDIETTLLSVDYIGPVCAPDFTQAFTYATDFSTLPLLHADTKVHAWAEWARKTGAQGDFWAGRHFENLMLAIQAARSGLGIIMTPQMLVKKDIQQGTLVAPLGFVEVDRATWMMVYAQRKEERAIRLFCRWLLEEAAYGEE